MIGNREDVLLAKYQILLKNWNINFTQCYCFDTAQQALEKLRFDCIIYCPFEWDIKAQYRRLRELNQRFKTPIKVWKES
ncbi:hypothetical protein [Microseira sp. BLCC-F43]|uniref:hypothetical protein n=1 Tax=Microseira sp. BLCC-F43 TaxID=3153602 RepID=UPI0035BAE143